MPRDIAWWKVENCVDFVGNLLLKLRYNTHELKVEGTHDEKVVSLYELVISLQFVVHIKNGEEKWRPLLKTEVGLSCWAGEMIKEKENKGARWEQIYCSFFSSTMLWRDNGNHRQEETKFMVRLHFKALGSKLLHSAVYIKKPMYIHGLASTKTSGSL